MGDWEGSGLYGMGRKWEIMSVGGAAESQIVVWFMQIDERNLTISRSSP